MAVKWTGKKIFATYGPYQGMTFEVLSEPYPAYGYMVLSVSDIQTGVMSEIDLNAVLYSDMYVAT